MIPKRRVVLVMPLLAAAALLIAATRSEPVSRRVAEQRAAIAWSKSHRNALPTTYADFAPLAKAYRKAVLHELSVAQQGSLWREHLQTFLEPASELTPLQQSMVHALGTPLNGTQIALVKEALDSLNRIFDSTLTLAQRQAVAAVICDRAKLIFTKSQASLIFATLGPGDSTDQGRVGSLDRRPATNLADVSSALVAVIRAIATRTHLVKPASNRGVCYCNIGSLCDCGSGACVDDGCLNVGYTSCGCFSIWACNGECMQG